MTEAADAIVAAARSWIGVRWRHQGAERSGCDCAGLVIGVARELGLSDVHPGPYGRLPTARRLAEECDRHMQRLPRLSAAGPGDVVAMAFDAGAQHLGILGEHPDGGLSVIHSFAPAHRVVEHRLDETWRARIVAIWRMRQGNR